MSFYNFFVNLYNQFLTLFPVQIQWLVTLMIVIGLVGAFISLIRHNTIFIVVLILLAPFLLPVLAHLFGDIYNFFLYLLQVLSLTSPKS